MRTGDTGLSTSEQQPQLNTEQQKQKIVANGWFYVLLLVAVFPAYSITDNVMSWDTLNVLAQAKLPFFDIATVVFNRDFHPPGVHWVLHVWMQFFGESDASMKSFSCFFVILSILGIWRLAVDVFQSKRIAYITTLIFMASPYVIATEIIATYMFHMAFCLWSWVFFLRLIKLPCTLGVIDIVKTSRFILYVLCTLLALHSFAGGGFYILFQGLYYAFFVAPKKNKTHNITFFVTGFLVVCTIIPFVINTMQPWHVAHTEKNAENHPEADWIALFSLPAHLMFLRFDIVYFPYMPAERIVMPYVWGALSLILVALGWLLKAYKKQFILICFIAVLPVLGEFGLTRYGNLPVFHYRTLMYVLPVIALVLALLCHDLWSNKSKFIKMLGGVLFLTVVGVAALNPHSVFKDRANLGFKESHAFYVFHTREFYQEGDGIVYYPGMGHLGFIRYFEPERFGLTENEKNVDPTKDNVFHMVQAVDDKYFLVSGKDVLKRPEVIAMYKKFESEHPRILVIGFEPEFLDMFDCLQQIYVLNNDGRFTRFPCLNR